MNFWFFFLCFLVTSLFSNYGFLYEFRILKMESATSVCRYFIPLCFLKSIIYCYHFSISGKMYWESFTRASGWYLCEFCGGRKKTDTWGVERILHIRSALYNSVFCWLIVSYSDVMLGLLSGNQVSDTCLKCRNF